jgi:hypothetical protein
MIQGNYFFLFLIIYFDATIIINVRFRDKFMKGVSRIVYNPDLNRVWHHCLPRVSAFLHSYGFDAIRRCLEEVVDEVTSNDDCDVQLGTCLASKSYTTMFQSHDYIYIAALAFPLQGKAKFKLRKEGDFFSNVHKDIPLIVVDYMQHSIFIHPEKTDNPLWLPGGKIAPNEIDGAMLFSTNPVDHCEDYEGFKEYLEWKGED